jgi:hypothetical protein
MRHRCRRPRAFTIVAALALAGVAACGGDDGDGGSAAATKQASSTAPGETSDGSATTGSGDDDAAGTNSTTTETTEPDVSGIDKDDDFCEGWLKAEKAFDTDEFDPATLDDMLPVLKDLAGKAPSELKADMNLLTDAFTQALPVLERMTQLNEEAMKDPAKAATMTSELAKLSAEVEVFSSPEFEQATARVSAYAEQKCGAKGS